MQLTYCSTDVNIQARMQGGRPHVRSFQSNYDGSVGVPSYMASAAVGAQHSSYPGGHLKVPGAGMTAHSTSESGNFLHPQQPPVIGRYGGHASYPQGLQQYAAAATATVSQHPVQLHASIPAGTSDECPENDRLKSVRDLPAAFHPVFSYRYFNAVQSECFDVAYKSDINMVVSAPTGAGKTGVMELAMLRLLSKHLQPGTDNNRHQQQFQPMHGSHKIVYIGPIKALVQERHNDWRVRYGCLGLNCVQLTGDVDNDQLDDELEGADIICTTPEKFDQTTRTIKEKGKMHFFAQLSLVLLDEVHLLNEAGRGSSLEAGCVCRIKAVAAVPEMTKAAIGSVRFVAVSATIPNIQDLAAWLSVPPTGIRQYGDELRPCKLTTHVKGYNPAKNDFLFERRLNEYVAGITASYSNGRPALVFCNSRKGTTDTAAIIAKEATTHCNSPTGSLLVRGTQQLERLQAAAAKAKAKGLGAVLVAGVGFHNAAMEPEDRDLVEGLFKSTDLQVLCTTSTLAMGVNLPAHLVVIKGTKRYVGESETAHREAAGYKEYTQTEVLQMVGRAGRPQFDDEGVAVIMTSKDSTYRYQKMMAGQAVESCLMANLAEHLNAELVLGTIQDVAGAIQWFKSSFLYRRVRSNPQHYGLSNKLNPGMSEAEVDSVIKNQLIMQPVSQLLDYGLATTDEDSYTLTSTKAGKLMANHFLKLQTMAAIVKLGERPNMPSLLRMICGAEEFKNTSLRRCEKKLLNELNHSSDPQQLRYHVMATQENGGTTGKVKERLSSPQEKLFVLLNDGLADKPSESLDYSLKQEQERLLLVGQRVAKCMARYYVERNSFSAAGRSLLLARSLRAKLWDDSQVEVRQLHGIGKLLAGRLSAAGLGSFQALMACNNAHQIEVAAQKPYPWGSELLATLRSILPPPISMQMQVLERLASGAVMCQLTLTRGQGPCQVVPNGNDPQLDSWAGTGRIRTPPSTDPAQIGTNNGTDTVARTQTPCKLLCGCSNTDQLLLYRNLVLETFESPLQLSFRVDPPANASEPINVSARLVLERFIGLDKKTSLTIPRQSGHAAATQQHGAAPLATQPAAACTDPPAASSGGITPFDNQAAQRTVTGIFSRKNSAKRTLAKEASVCRDDSNYLMAAAAAAVVGAGAAKRQRIETNCDSATESEPLLQAQHLRQVKGRQPVLKDVSNSYAWNDVATQQGVSHALQADGYAPTSSARLTSHIPPYQPKTAIAARYNSIRSQLAGSTGSLKQQAAGNRRNYTVDTSEATGEDGAAALDSGGLQVTPEHQQHMQHGSGQHQRGEQNIVLIRKTSQATSRSSSVDAHDPAVQGACTTQGSPEQLHVAGTESMYPGSDTVGALGIAAMFDMLADDSDFCPQVHEKPHQRLQQGTTEQAALVKMRQQQSLSQQQPCRQTASILQDHECTAPRTTAAVVLSAPNISTASAYTAAGCASAAMAPGAGAADGAAVSQSSRNTTARKLDTEHSVHLSTATAPDSSNNLLSWQRSGISSKPVGLGAVPASSQQNSCHSGITSFADRSKATLLPTGLAKPISAPGPQLPPPVLMVEQHQQKLSRWSHQAVGSRSAGISAATTMRENAAAAGMAEQSLTVGVDSMTTPPRQIVRSSLPGSLLDPDSVSNAHRGNRISDLQQHSDNVAKELQLGCYVAGDDSPQQVGTAAALEQFAFVPDSQKVSLSQTYKPSQNSAMFQRSASATNKSTTHRALAQAKLGGRQLSSSKSKSSLAVCQRGGCSADGRSSNSTRTALSRQLYETAPRRAAAMQPPPAPLVQWQGFVDNVQQQDRLQAINQARGTWRSPASMYGNDMLTRRHSLMRGHSASEYRASHAQDLTRQVASGISETHHRSLNSIGVSDPSTASEVVYHTQYDIRTGPDTDRAGAKMQQIHPVDKGSAHHLAAVNSLVNGRVEQLPVHPISGTTTVPAGDRICATSVAAEAHVYAQQQDDVAAEHTGHGPGVNEDAECPVFGGIFVFMKS